MRLLSPTVTLTITPPGHTHTKWSSSRAENIFLCTFSDYLAQDANTQKPSTAENTEKTYFLADVSDVDVEELESWLHTLGEQTQLATNSYVDNNGSDS